MEYHSFIWTWVRIVFPFHPFKASFISLQGKLTLFTVTTVDDCLFHGIYQFTHHPWVWPLIQISVIIGNSIPSPHIFTILRVSGCHWSTRSPPQMRMHNGSPFIINCSSPGGGLRGGVFHKCSDIYKPPPQNRPILEDAKQILPLTGDATKLVRVPMPEWSLIWGWGLGCCLLNAYAATRGQQHPTQNNKAYYMRSIPDARCP